MDIILVLFISVYLGIGIIISLTFTRMLNNKKAKLISLLLLPLMAIFWPMISWEVLFRKG